MVKNMRIETKWAAIFVLMTLAWMLHERLFGLHAEHLDKHAIVTNLIMIPAILIFVLALRDKRKNFYGGSMTYMQGFLTGAVISVLVMVVSPLTQYVISTFISPDYFANVIRYSVEQGTMTQQAAEEYFNLKNYMILSAIGSLVMGLLTSAVVAIFMRKKSVS